MGLATSNDQVKESAPISKTIENIENEQECKTGDQCTNANSNLLDVCDKVPIKDSEPHSHYETSRDTTIIKTPTDDMCQICSTSNDLVIKDRDDKNTELSSSEKGLGRDNQEEIKIKQNPFLNSYITP